MKKILTGLAALALLATGAFANSSGYGKSSTRSGTSLGTGSSSSSSKSQMGSSKSKRTPMKRSRGSKMNSSSTGSK